MVRIRLSIFESTQSITNMFNANGAIRPMSKDHNTTYLPVELRIRDVLARRCPGRN